MHLFCEYLALKQCRETGPKYPKSSAGTHFIVRTPPFLKGGIYLPKNPKKEEEGQIAEG